MKNLIIILLAIVMANNVDAQVAFDTAFPVNSEVVNLIHKPDFNNGGECLERRQGGNPRVENGYLVFNGSMDGDRQVHLQIAVGGGYIMEGSNRGLIIYN